MYKRQVLNIVRRKVELKCLSENIPNELVVDLADVDIGASFKISSIKLPENVTPTIQGRDFVVATLAAPTVIKEPEKATEETAEEGAEASTEGVKEEKKLLKVIKKRVIKQKLIKVIKKKLIKRLPLKKNNLSVNISKFKLKKICFYL